MAVRVLAATQTYSSPTLADTVTNTMTQHATTNITIGNSSYYTVAYTAANTGDELTGVLLYIAAVGTGGTITINLQQNSAGWVDVDTLVAGEGTVTVNTTDLKKGGWFYFRYTKSFTATATTAGYYRVKVTGSGMTGTTAGAANSAGTALSYLATDNRNTTTKPGNTDDLVVAGVAGAAITLTMDGTQTVGSGTHNAATSTEARSLRNNAGTHAIDICAGAILADDVSASVSLTIKGNFVVRDLAASYRNNGVNTAYPSSYTTTYLFDESSVSGNFGIIKASGGVLDWVGMAKASGNPNTVESYSSGAGTAADPMITTGDIGEVGDEIIIEAVSDNATNYNEAESKYIKTKNSTTSYVLADTAGGAESTLTYTHTDAKIYNISGNVKTTSTSASYGWFCQNWETVTRSNFNCKWNFFEYCGSGLAYKQAFFVTNISSGVGTVDYCKLVRRLGIGFSHRSSAVSETFTGNIICSGVSTSTVGGLYFDSSSNKTLNDYVLINERRVAITTSGAANNIFNRLNMNACGKDGGITGTCYLTGGVYGWKFYDSNFNCNRVQAVYANNAIATFYNCNFGVAGKNQTYTLSVSGLNTLLFYECNSNDDTLVSGYTGQFIGSIIKFHNLNNDATEMNHTWYTPYGTAQCCMAGLTDTTETASGHPTVRISPEDSADGFTWEFQVPVFENYSGNILALLQRNATFSSGAVTVEIWLPGSTSADATYTMSNVTGAWETASSGITYPGTVDGLATIKINAKTATPGAYLYVGDIYGGSNKITSLDVWFDGMPSSLMFDQIGNPASIWAVLASTQTTVGTMGYKAVETRNLAGLIPATL